MDSRIRKLLEAFDAPGTAAPSDSEIKLDSLGDADDLRALAEDLVTRGWLRPTEIADTYRRTEEGRLVLAGPLDVTLYTRPGCHLCEEMKAQIAPLLKRSGATLREINIDADATLRERYDIEVPVMLLGTRKVAKYRVDLDQFRRQLDEAKRAAHAASDDTRDSAIRT